MNENARTAQLIKTLNSVIDCRAKKRHGGMYQQGDADIAGCFRGRAFFIEVKLYNGHLTQLQATELGNWRHSFAVTAVAIWRDDVKGFKLVTPSDSESWIELAGSARDLYDESITCPVIPLKPSTRWYEWLDSFPTP